MRRYEACAPGSGLSALRGKLPPKVDGKDASGDNLREKAEPAPRGEGAENFNIFLSAEDAENI